MINRPYSRLEELLEEEERVRMQKRCGREMKDLHKQSMADPAYKDAYDALEDTFCFQWNLNHKLDPEED